MIGTWDRTLKSRQGIEEAVWKYKIIRRGMLSPPSSSSESDCPSRPIQMRGMRESLRLHSLSSSLGCSTYQSGHSHSSRITLFTWRVEILSLSFSHHFSMRVYFLYINGSASASRPLTLAGGSVLQFLHHASFNLLRESSISPIVIRWSICRASRSISR